MARYQFRNRNAFCQLSDHDDSVERLQWSARLRQLFGSMLGGCVETVSVRAAVCLQQLIHRLLEQRGIVLPFSHGC